jgi:shikimate dehydrogenase
MNYRFALIGYPIKHSLSPWIHERFLQKARLQGTYMIREIGLEENFEKQVRHLMDDRIDGFNVTVPYKKKIMSLLDEIDPLAQKIGAVNTVTNDNGKWVGYNTDGIGYVRSLESKFPNLIENLSQRILLIGAGGAARGIYSALDHKGFTTIDIANRTKERAVEIAELGGVSTNTNIISLQEAVKHLQDYDLVIQTTSVGMKPNQDAAILELEQVKPNGIVSDIVYQPLMTRMLRDAKQLGASIHFGHTMLLYQAQYAFEIWTGIKVSIENMDDELQLILEGR